MQYHERAAELLGDAIEKLRALDHLAMETKSHRLDDFQPLIVRLDSIRQDLLGDTGMIPASRKTAELNARLSGGFARMTDPKYRSLLASLLGQYQRSGMPPKSKLGGLRGGRPRKDGTPRQTLELKGYTAENLPPPKKGGIRVHPALHEIRRKAKNAS